jgi:hypothetical protein
MSEGDKQPTPPARFVWTDQRAAAAVLLANGHTVTKAAKDAGVSRQTLHEWMRVPEFAVEVDRLTLLSDIANRSHRLRIAMRMIRKKEKVSEKDLLDWLKYAQSETDGANLNLSALFGDLAGAAGSGAATDDKAGGAATD